MQETMAITNSTNKLQIMTLELPYILGRNFQMTELFNTIGLQIVANKPVPYFDGSGIFCTMEEAAQAIVNIFEVGKQSMVYTLATMNISWKDIITEAKTYFGNNARLVKFGKIRLTRLFKKYKKENDKQKIENGLNYNKYTKLITCNEQMDVRAICKFLDLKGDADWKEEVHKTVDYVKGKFIDDLQIRNKKTLIIM